MKIRKQAKFRFYEELNDFLPDKHKKTDFFYSFVGNPSVKDAIEAIGIPHVEVDLILVNGNSVPFSYRLNKDDRISVYPVFEKLDITNVTHLREKPLRITRFILDVHLGKLAKYIRLCGFDSLYRNDLEDNEIIEISVKEKRIILTRDVKLLKHGRVTHGYWLRSQDPKEQILEVINAFHLKDQINEFSRCIECNDQLSAVDKHSIRDSLEPLTMKYYDIFYKCKGCKKVFWKGSHYRQMQKFIRYLNS